MFKKLVSLICVMIVSIFCFGIAVSAEIIAPCTLYTDSASSTLTISETTATCSSTAKGYANVTTKIVIKQTLQKKSSSGIWCKVASWSETDTGYKGSATNTKSGLSSGTYRLKTIFTVYAGSDYETITKYSSEKTV